MILFIFGLNLSQLVNSPTHSHGNILDLALRNIYDSIHSLTVQTNNQLMYFVKSLCNYIYNISHYYIAINNPPTYITFLKGTIKDPLISLPPVTSQNIYNMWSLFGMKGHIMELYTPQLYDSIKPKLK